MSQQTSALIWDLVRFSFYRFSCWVFLTGKSCMSSQDPFCQVCWHFKIMTINNSHLAICLLQIIWADEWVCEHIHVCVCPVHVYSYFNGTKQLDKDMKFYSVMSPIVINVSFTVTCSLRSFMHTNTCPTNMRKCYILLPLYHIYSKQSSE